MNTSKFFIGRTIGFIIVLLILGGIFLYKRSAEAPVVVQGYDIRGCYISALAKDVYTLKVDTQEGENFSGTLQFKNFEKDSSSGTYIGTYVDGVLSGEYAFQSEGLDSKVNTRFKKVGEAFVRGIESENGDVTFNGDTAGSVFMKGECL